MFYFSKNSSIIEWRYIDVVVEHPFLGTNKVTVSFCTYYVSKTRLVNYDFFLNYDVPLSFKINAVSVSASLYPRLN